MLWIALAATAMGCSKRMDVVMRNPLQVGVVDQPNTIQQRNGWQATMTRLDPEAMCFDVSFMIEQPHGPPDAYLQSQQLLMKSDGQWYEDAQVAEVREPSISSYAGTVAEQQQSGTVQECAYRNANNQCERWETRPRYVTVYVPATFYRAESGGVVCFPNNGRVTVSSDRVVFQINRVNFRWGLEDITAQTSGGEEEEG